MGALISLFISLLMMVVSLTLSLLMTTFNLMMSLLRRGVRQSARGSSYRPHTTGAAPKGNHSLGIFLAIVFGFFILLAVDPRLAVVVLIIVGVVWWVRRPSTRYRTPAASELAQLFKSIHLMSGPQFEAFMASVFKSLGYRTAILGGSGDQGVDILLAGRNHQRIAVQCKNHAKPVGNRPVQEVFAGMRHHRCNQAWVVAPAGYTKGAYDLARSVGVSLFDSRNIKRWISQAGSATPVPDESTQSVATLQQHTSTPSPAPRREPPNTQASKNHQRQNGLQSASAGGDERDRQEYEELLDRHRSLLKSMDIHTSAMEERHQHFGLEPEAENKYREQRALALQRSEVTRRMLDYLEEHNPELASGELSKRRTELNLEEEKLKKRSERVESKGLVVGEQTTERKPDSDDFKPLEL